MFTATPPPIKQVLQPDTSKPVKPQKQFKRSTGREMDNSERSPVKENKENKNTDMKTSKTVEKKFPQKIKIKNATELFQTFPTKANLNNGYLKEHFRNFEILVSEMYHSNSIIYPLFQ